jgi:hypothetical protein
MKRHLATLALISFTVLAFLYFALMGDGALKRHFTKSGIYTVCKPGGYPMVCALDADGSDGGLFCLPLAEVGGKCL